MSHNFELFQNFKGGLYIKLFESNHTETGETFVHYISVADGKPYSRPKDMFYENVNRDDYSGPRFIKVPPIISKKLKNLKVIDNGSQISTHGFA